MNKTLKWFLISFGVALLIGFLCINLLKASTKRHSPQLNPVFVQGDLNIELEFSSPSKKGREVFGGLVPYGEVWRTGANEPTTFKTNKNLQFGTTTLPAGSYSVFTIPQKDQWTIIFNEGSYDWGLNWDGSSPRDPSLGETILKTSPLHNPEYHEQLSIAIAGTENLSVEIAWDEVLISLPFTY